MDLRGRRLRDGKENCIMKNCTVGTVHCSYVIGKMRRGDSARIGEMKNACENLIITPGGIKLLATLDVLKLIYINVVEMNSAHTGNQLP